MKYLVIGLGTYGRELAINLSLQGNEVIGVDHRSENIEAVKEQLMTYTISTLPERLQRM